jgi:tetratricopeptide (TPR) repeat protein
MRTFFTALTLLLLFPNANAQRFGYKTVQDTFFFRFVFSEEETEPYQGYFLHGSLTPETFAEGSVYPLYSGFVLEPDKSHGNASVNFVDQGTSGLAIKLSSSQDGQRIFKQLEGIIALPMKIPAKDFRSIFYDMVKNDIYLFDIMNGQPFYNLDQILAEDNPQLEQSILKAMLKESVFVAEEMVKQGMESPLVVGGRFDGLDLFTAMKQSDISDIRSFLRYVQFRPRKYQGINWPFAEVYATWIDGGSPSTSEDVEALLLSNLNDYDKFRKYLSSYNKEDYPKLAEIIRQRAIELKAASNKLNEAMAFANVALKVSEAAEDNKSIAWSHLEIAGIQHQLHTLSDAIQSYKKSIEFFEISSDRAGLLMAYNNLGSCLNQRGKEDDYNEAVVFLTRAEQLTGFLGKGESAFTTIAQLYRNLGDSYVGLGKLKKAVEVYDVGLTYTGADTALSLKRRSILYMQLANVYEKLNKKVEAEEYTRKGVMTYKHYEELVSKDSKT